MKSLNLAALSIAVFIFALIAAEMIVPLDWKPSILLRQSTGELPSNPKRTFMDEVGRMRQAKAEAAELHQQATDLAASVNRIENARVQLNGRIRQKVTELNRYRP